MSCQTFYSNIRILLQVNLLLLPENSGVDRYILFCGPMFVPACFKPTQFQGKISPRFGTELYFVKEQY